MNDLDAALLVCLYRVRLATVVNLKGLLFGYGEDALAAGRQRLAKAGLVDHRRLQSGHTVWALTREGHRTVAATYDVRPRRYVDIDGLNTPHTRGTSRVVAALSYWTNMWEWDDPEERDEYGWEVEVALPYGGRRFARPDAAIRYTKVTGEGGWYRHAFVEYDRGTADGLRRVNKLVAYNKARTYRPRPPKARARLPAPVWEDRYSYWPWVLFVFDNMSEAGAQRRIGHLCHLVKNSFQGNLRDSVGSDLVVAATTMEQLTTLNPYLNPIFTAIPHGEKRRFPESWRSKPPKPTQPAP